MDIEQEIQAALQLQHTARLGPVTVQKLLPLFGSLHSIVSARAQDLRDAGLNEHLCSALKTPDHSAIERDCAWQVGPQRHFIACTDPRYPRALAQLADAPTLLYAQGDTDLLNTPQLAVVGSRNPSPSGQEVGEQLAQDLAAQGLTITSGLAQGIDAAAHRGALRAHGLTVAVTGTGLDRVYPAAHRELAHQIAASGLLLSEFAVGTLPHPGNFPTRNRLISGLSLATLVVEAALKSGSLITASRALEQGRDVFALPGSVHNPLAKGCHQLIRQGAKLVESSEHILEELAPKLGQYRQALQTPPPPTLTNPDRGGAEAPVDSTLEAEQLALLSHMDSTPQSIDTYVHRSGLRAEDIASMLLILELEGYVIAEGGGCYRKA